MNKEINKNISICIFIAILLAVISICLLVTKVYMYLAITGSLLVIDFIFIAININSSIDANALYESNIKYILKTFDSVLAYLDCKVEFDDKEIIKLESFDDLVNCQEEIKKPLLYKYNDESAFFMLLDKKILYYTVLKKDENIINEFEIEIENSNKRKIRKKKEKEEEVDESILDEIDRTTIIQTKNKRKYKVSPIIDLPKKKGE